MNLVFIGASSFGLHCLEACLEIPGIIVTGVVTAPEIFEISYRPKGVTNVLHADFTSVVKTHQIPVLTLRRSMNDVALFESVQSLNPDAFLVAGWYHMIPKSWRELAPAYGLHASLLPDYSGGAPLVWAIINGEEKTGITLFQMDDGVDSGPIAGQKEVSIYSDDTIATLYSRIEQSGLELLGETLPQLVEGRLKLRSQNESYRRLMPQRGPEDGLIDWQQNATFIERFIRAQTRPYPGAFTTFNGKPLHIWQASIVDTTNSDSETGKIEYLNSDVYIVYCGKGALQLKEVSYESKTYKQSQLVGVLGGGGSSWADRKAA